MSNETIKIRNKLNLIGAASCWGARDRRCDQSPDILRKKGIETALTRAELTVSWLQNIYPKALHISDRKDIDHVVDLCRQLAVTVDKVVRNNEYFAVIGGDHSCAMGTWSGAATALEHKGPLGLVWIDAHMDSHVPETSPSDALHGMPLACLFGYGIKELTDIGKAGPHLAPHHVCLVGVRQYEPEEANLLETLGVRVFFMDEIKERGLEAVMTDALSIVKNGTAGFGVSLDLDAIDPVDAPGVGTPVHDGITAHALLAVLPKIKRDPLFIGAEITEMNPYRDVQNKTVDLTIDLLHTMF